MVTCTVDQLYSKSNAASDSRTESESDSDSGGELATHRDKPGQPRNTTLQDTRKKETTKVKLLNDITSRHELLKTMYYPQSVPTKVMCAWNR